jgi:hypothetical protein
MPDENDISVPSNRLWQVAGFKAAGLFAGFVTAGSSLFVHRTNPFLGAVFGVVLAACLYFSRRTKSFGQITALIGSSIVAYFVAVWSPVFVWRLLVSLRILKDNGAPDLYGLGAFSIAGFAGAFIILLAVFLLFSPAEGWRVPAKAFSFSLIGAVLGLGSSAASERLGEVVLKILGYLPLDALGGTARDGLMAEPFCSAYLIWQTGMAGVIASALPKPVLALSRSGQFVPVTPVRERLSNTGKVFVFLMLAGATTLGYFQATDRLRAWKNQHESEKSWRQAPAADGLPEVAPQPLERMLILREISGHAPGVAEMKIVPAHKEYRSGSGVSGYSSRTFPSRAVYSMGYHAAGQTSINQPAVWVQVLEFPNAEWAKYQLKDVPFEDAKFISSTNIRTITDFGRPVLVDEMKGGHDRYVFWPSTNKVVVLHLSGPGEDEFVRRYLAKHPTSL